MGNRARTKAGAEQCAEWPRCCEQATRLGCRHRRVQQQRQPAWQSAHRALEREHLVTRQVAFGLARRPRIHRSIVGDQCVGAGARAIGTTQHLLHWNGHGWRNSAFPGTPGTFYGNLGLAAAPRGRAWLIASSSGSSLIFGWNGTGWKHQLYPCSSTFCNLDRVVARTGSDAWAVGNYVTSSLDGGPLALHWTGHSWHSTPVPFVKFGYLTGVFAVSATNAWAVGGVNNSSKMLLYRWNGASWHSVPVPAGLTVPSLGELTGISGDTSGHLWIFDFGQQAANRAAYLRYDGHRWTKVMGALIAGQSRVIVRDVATVPGTSASWSVGLGFVPTVNARARIERYGKF